MEIKDEFIRLHRDAFWHKVLDEDGNTVEDERADKCLKEVLESFPELRWFDGMDIKTLKDYLDSEKCSYVLSMKRNRIMCSITSGDLVLRLWWVVSIYADKSVEFI